MNFRKLIVFILCAFIPMCGVGLFMHFGGVSSATLAVEGADDPLLTAIITILSAGAMMLPLLAVVITQLIFKEPILKGLDISFKINRWWIIGWILMPVVALLILGVTLLMPGAVFTPESEVLQMALASMPEGFGVWSLIGVIMISGLFAGLTLNALFAFGEEIAWRGYLIKLFKGKKFMTMALWSGVIWGLWHAPLVLNGHNYPQHPVAGVFMMIIFCLLLTPMLLYFRKKGGSVILPAIMHGTFNAVVGISLILVSPVNDILYGASGLAGFIALLLVNICLYLYDRFISKENIFSSCL